ncbi:Protein of unknown function [Haladaptatus litoreus]|uniref:DUF3054 domain-containing protein n=1 Tax=Haladaptatus litoreus TaxID=553468 RepID=A0A1N6X2V4_9EURY|nr:DUF3054 domain-containing protein [Haladaptatus litoreus]SIQ96643.1 Protein of unknown function [Haladaptatus litoreus]
MSSVFATGRFDRSPATAGLVIGDVVVITGLLWMGSLRHDVNPMETPLLFADTLAPFLIGWVVASLVLGAYSGRARRSLRDAALLGGGTWIIAALIGTGLRATSLFHGNSPLSFVLVVTGLGLVSVVIWRGLVAAVTP